MLINCYYQEDNVLKFYSVFYIVYSAFLDTLKKKKRRRKKKTRWLKRGVKLFPVKEKDSKIALPFANASPLTK